MPVSQEIIWVAVFCCLFIVLLLFGKPLKVLFKLSLWAAISAVCITLFNSFLSPFGIAVGINAVTLLIVSVLGAPGFAVLYITCSLL